jgi:hypothetical protein
MRLFKTKRPLVIVGGEGLRELTREEVEEALWKVKPSMDRFRKELPKCILKGKVEGESL